MTLIDKRARHCRASFFGPSFTQGAVVALLGAVVLLPVAAMAAVPVVDLSDQQVKVTPARADTAAPPAAGAASMPQDRFSVLFQELQALQQEVQQLRGLVEQQEFLIRKLEQQQKDNYLDTDRRLVELQQARTQEAVPAPDTTALPALVANPAAEKDSYQKAYALLDQNHKDEAALAFRKHLLLYPQGEFAPNARYWLAQIYITQAQWSEAETQLTALLQAAPQHHKAMDARFSLGKVYFQQGKKDEARRLIQEVANGSGPTAELAKTFLQANFKN